MTELRTPNQQTLPQDRLAARAKPMQWSDAFEMGDPEIDAEHRAFFDIINELSEAIRARTESARLAALCDLLVEHSAAHFLHEEEIMEQQGFGGLAAHRREHRRLLAYIRERAVRLSEPAAVVAEQAEAALDIKDALLGHMLRVDVHYKTHLLERRRRPG